MALVPVEPEDDQAQGADLARI